ncbi:MAG: GspE/PulE family protein [Desulfobacteraceae bacterium]|jgi:general secretion pathway protein E
MSFNTSHPLAAKNICRILAKQGLIPLKKTEEILLKESELNKKLFRASKNSSSENSQTINDPFHFIELLVHLNLMRLDNNNRPLDEDAIFQALALDWQIPFTKIDPLKLDLNVVTNTLPKSFAVKHLVLPISIEKGVLTVATCDPFNTEVFDDISRASGQIVKPVVSPKTDIRKLLNEFFGFKKSIVAAESQFSGPKVDLGNLEQYVRLNSEDEVPSNDHHVVNAVNHLFLYAFDQKASDIHIEPKREISLVRMRIDGTLHTVYKLPQNIHSAIISRIKNLSRMDMAEKRRPQDGRIKTDKGDVEVEIRVSTIPVAFGEKVVMRIMDPDILFQDLEKLGFSDSELMRYKSFVNLPHGIVLVCGPTGSGKSTTLYSTLRKLYSPEINITTVEDPIEMVHEEFNQIAVQPQVGITFGTILRNILRQDPDIIMLGEMRDLETAENAIQAALTGHLVLSTLHTNDAASSIIRLLDLGVASFLIQSTLVGILAQRLVRRICSHCKEFFDIESEKLNNLGIDIRQLGKIRLAHGKGCQRCRGTGYKGRVGIFEVLPYTDSLRQLTTRDTDIALLKKQAIKEGMMTLRQSAIDKLLKCSTTYQEVLRVTWEQL